MNLNLYEEVLILDPDLDNRTREELVTKVKGLITGEGGEILKTETWGQRKLAYELNKREKGYYILLYFKAPPSSIVKVERLCRVSEHIIKFMIIRFKKKKHLTAIMSSLTKSEDSASEGKLQEKGAN
jgi:small subunit ribosomal protein S6